MIDSTKEAGWRKARDCSNGNCVEVAKQGDRYLIRDSTAPGVVLSVSEAEWQSFVRGVEAGDFSFE
ncbi:DUF397 domain-containing protein [Actinoplanes sp. URMC 104]|uniref:DUF397 domain-containing protein n=1 Tax=Actinoplanes sp. URMC 104 TaxID=3423409 RepID=UPI003F19D1C5